MSLYIPISVEPVEAVTLDFSINSQEYVIDFIGPRAKKGPDGSVVIVASELVPRRVLHTGSWVVKHKDGTIEVYDNVADFSRAYKPFQHPTF